MVGSRRLFFIKDMLSYDCEGTGYWVLAGSICAGEQL